MIISFDLLPLFLYCFHLNCSVRILGGNFLWSDPPATEQIVSYRERFCVAIFFFLIKCFTVKELLGGRRPLENELWKEFIKFYKAFF